MRTLHGGWFSLIAAAVFFLPAAAQAQSAIAGVVRDSSGAVLPGVTVEAKSPALIEGTRSVTTDSSGQYRIVDLRPGTYAVTFTLPGFNVAMTCASPGRTPGAGGERELRFHGGSRTGHSV